MLKQAVKNSKAKHYHGTVEEMHTLPTSEEQIKCLLSKVPTVADFFETRTIATEPQQ